MGASGALNDMEGSGSNEAGGGGGGKELIGVESLASSANAG